MGYEDGELHVKYLGREYDVTRFRKFHPGGANTLAWFRGSDVTSQLVHTHHSEAAYSLLEDYRVGAQLQGDIDEVESGDNVNVEFSSSSPSTVQRLESDVTDLTTGIWSHVRLRRSKKQFVLSLRRRHFGISSEEHDSLLHDSGLVDSRRCAKRKLNWS
ncbi:Fatty acid 2-hydroxylase [Homalodisca vitripennis]|nr:Fatty acid 2-hydroxylase [Homalodisca vitripennis]